jgi:hypothetical protein
MIMDTRGVQPHDLLSRCVEVLGQYASSETANTPSFYEQDASVGSLLLMSRVCHQGSVPTGQSAGGQGLTRFSQQQLEAAGFVEHESLRQALLVLIEQHDIFNLLARAIAQALKVALQHLEQLTLTQQGGDNPLVEAISQLSDALQGAWLFWRRREEATSAAAAEACMRAGARTAAAAGDTQHSSLSRCNCMLLKLSAVHQLLCCIWACDGMPWT